jgi:hypothetical protein
MISKIAKFREMRQGGENCLILPDGFKVDCDGCLHSIKAIEAGFASLAEVLAAGVCRTHWNSHTGTFAVECGTELTGDQMKTIRGILRGIRAYLVVMNIAGEFTEKSDTDNPIRKIF